MGIKTPFPLRFFVPLLLSLAVFPSGLQAQNTGVGFALRGSTVKELLQAGTTRAQKTRLSKVSISIYSDSTFLRDVTTDAKAGSFSTHLAYGHVYKLVFRHPLCVTMFSTIDARIPKNMYTVGQTIDMTDIPCKDLKSLNLDTVKYRFAFDRYNYDEGAKKIIQDQRYYSEFFEGKTQEILDYKRQIKDRIENGTLPNPTQAQTQKLKYLIGKLLAGDAPYTAIKNVKVSITGDRGDPVQTCVSNSAGRFVFENLLLDQGYIIKVEATDLGSFSGQLITLVNKDDIEVRSGKPDGTWIFHMLPADKRSIDLLSSEDCTYIISGNLLALINNQNKPIANTKVQLSDAGGNVIEAMITNEFGTFVFTKVPVNQTFMIQLAENNPDLRNVKVIVTDQSGKEISSTVCDNSGKFNFQFLKQDEIKFKTMEVEESKLQLDIGGRLFKNTQDKAIANTQVDLVDKHDKVVQTVTTDQSGNFKFSKVPYQREYSLALGSDGIQRVIVTTPKGIVINEYKSGQLVNSVKFPLLPGELQKISKVFVKDPWVNVSDDKQEITIPEKVYFDVNDDRITPQGMVILDKVVQVMKKDPVIHIEISSHTDSQGSSEYNLELSQKRANAAVEYMVSKGINKKRLTGIGYGETRLLNKCKDGITCTEEEHAQNRRLEFKISFSKK